MRHNSTSPEIIDSADRVNHRADFRRAHYIQCTMGDGDSGDDNGDSGDDDFGEGDVATETRTKTKRPKLYKVLLHNDDYTTMEFVISVLISVFHMTEEQAIQVTLHVHQKGVGVAGVFSFEIAETKVEKVMNFARENEYPLRCTCEPE